MAKGLSAAEQAAKWAANTAAAGGNWINGVNKVTASPMAKAAKNLQKAKQNYTAAVDNGTMRAKLEGVSTSSWQASCTAKQGNFSNGVTAAESKMTASLNKWVPIRNSIAAQVNAMPDDTYAQRKARANAMMDGMHAAKVGAKA